jgi:hypothetical protein
MALWELMELNKQTNKQTIRPHTINDNLLKVLTLAEFVEVDLIAAFV